jgi:predicted transcriptional regulator
MFARDLIAFDIPPLKLSDSGKKALRWMDDFKVNHLPVANNKEYLGLISDSDIFDFNKTESIIRDYDLKNKNIFVLENQHIYDVVKLIYNEKISVIPVLSHENEFVGSISSNHLNRLMAEVLGVNNPGGVIVLQMNYNDYSMTEIAQIIEGNDAKILSSYLRSIPISDAVEITIKINKKDVSAILQSFERYNYQIKAVYHESVFEDDFKDKLDSFFNYLNI